MNKVWKWIVGIALVLVVVAVLVGVPFVVRNVMTANISIRATQQTAPGIDPQALGWNRGPMMRGNDDWQRQAPGRFNGYRGPMMGGGRNFERGFSRFGGFAPFGLGFTFLGGLLRLIPLALFGLLLYGVYQLGKRSGLRSTYVPAPVSTEPASPPAASEEKPAE